DRLLRLGAIQLGKLIPLVDLLDASIGNRFQNLTLPFADQLTRAEHKRPIWSTIGVGMDSTHASQGLTHAHLSDEHNGFLPLESFDHTGNHMSLRVEWLAQKLGKAWGVRARNVERPCSYSRLLAQERSVARKIRVQTCCLHDCLRYRGVTRSRCFDS